MEAHVLRLELLASNLHDSLDLSPLFKDAYPTLSATRRAGSEELVKRLTYSAQEVVRVEVDAIREAFTIRAGVVVLEGLKKGPVALFEDQAVSLAGSAGPPRTSRVEVLSHDERLMEFLVRLAVWRAGDPPVVELQTKSFHAGPSDFPLIANTRLAGGDRMALTFDGVAEDVARIVLVYFPGPRASMKDKQYYEDAAADLLRIEERNRE